MVETTISFDKPVYAPGDTITATVTVSGLEGATEDRTGSGSVTLDNGSLVTFTGEFVIQHPTPKVISGTMSSGEDARVWTFTGHDGTSATFTATA